MSETGSYWNFRENRRHTRRWRAVSARTGLNEERSSRGQVIDSDCEELCARARVCVCLCVRARVGDRGGGARGQGRRGARWNSS